MKNFPKKPTRISKSLRKTILERDGYKCVECGFYSFNRPGLLHIDHKHPSSKGGPNTQDNLRTLCGDCNLKKNNTTPKCPNCGDWFVADKPICPSCGFRVSNVVNINKTSKGTNKPLIRKLLLLAMAALSVYLVVVIVLAGYAYFSNRTVRMASSKVQSTLAGAVCNTTEKANLKARCDSQDCDNDARTVVGTIPEGKETIKTGFTVASELSSVGEWTEITFNNQLFYIASTKLSCKTTQ